jgi:DNA-binding NarL/FixJ family response regulator
LAPAADAHPCVLLGTLDPILRLGIVRALLDDGVSVIDGAEAADALVERAAQHAPDAVVLGAAAGGARGAELRARLRSAAPGATLVVWRNDAELIEVLPPGASTPRVMSPPSADRLALELLGGGNEEGGPCPAT